LTIKASIWLKGFILMFFIYIGQSLIYCFSRIVQILFGVSVANVSMMVWGKKDASPDKLSVKLIASGSLGIRFISLEGYEKHGCNTA
jgi:hypothetical protein